MTCLTERDVAMADRRVRCISVTGSELARLAPLFFFARISIRESRYRAQALGS
jgi:hypothetical protein